MTEAQTAAPAAPATSAPTSAPAAAPQQTAAPAPQGFGSLVKSDATAPAAATAPAQAPAQTAPAQDAFQLQDDKGLYLGKYKSIEDLGKAYKTAEAKIRELGDKVPKVPDAYDLKNFDAAGLNKWESEEVRDTTLNAFKQAGYTQAQLDAMAPVAKQMFDRRDAQWKETIQNVYGFVPTEQHVKEQVAALKNEWGDEFDTKLAVSQRALDGLPQSVKSAWQYDAGVVKLAYELATLKRGAPVIKEGSNLGPGASVEAQVSEIIRRTGPEYFREHSPIGKEARRQVEALTKNMPPKFAVGRTTAKR